MKYWRGIIWIITSSFCALIIIEILRKLILIRINNNIINGIVFAIVYAATLALFAYIFFRKV